MAVSLAFMTILTFIQVMMREFGAGWVWSLESTTYAFAWMILIGMSYGVRTQAHIAIALVSNKLPPKARRIMALTAVALCLLYCGFMFYGGSLFVNGLMTLGNNARDIPLPRWLLTIMMPPSIQCTRFGAQASADTAQAPSAGPQPPRRATVLLQA